MNEFKYQITQLIFLLLLGFGAYWAFTNLDSGMSYEREDRVAIIDEGNQLPVDDVTEPPVVDTSDTTDIPDESNDENNDVPSEDDNTLDTSDLIDRLNDLADSETMLNNGSSGEAVRTVQEFLAIYHDQDITIDGDFGPGTKNLVQEFQQEELNGGDGRVGPNTLQGMVTFLEEN